MNYVDLDINATSEIPKIKDMSVSYAEVVIPTSRKVQPIENNQQIDKNDQEKKAASLKVGCSNFCFVKFILLMTWLKYATCNIANATAEHKTRASVFMSSQD